MIFNPHPEYKYLLMQARAMHTLINHNEQMIAYQSTEIDRLKSIDRKYQEDEIEGLRYSNERLTNLLEPKK